jgi:hypothetical protein
MSAKSDRRARKKGRRAAGQVDGIRVDVLGHYLGTRIVCDTCGLEQYDGGEDVDGRPCPGPLGLGCSGESAQSAANFLNQA